MLYEKKNGSNELRVSTETFFSRKIGVNSIYFCRFTENLLNGTHRYRIRALSIETDGLFSDWQIVLVEQPPMSSYIRDHIWGAILIVLSFVAAIVLVMVLCHKYKKFRKPFQILLPGGGVGSYKRDEPSEGGKSTSINCLIIESSIPSRTGYEMEAVSSPTKLEKYKNMRDGVKLDGSFQLGNTPKKDLLNVSAMRAKLVPQIFPFELDVTPKIVIDDDDLPATPQKSELEDPYVGGPSSSRSPKSDVEDDYLEEPLLSKGASDSSSDYSS